MLRLLVHSQTGSLEAVLGQVGEIVKFRNTVVGKGGFMKAIRYFVGILLFCGMCFGSEAAERPGKEKKEKKPVPEFPFKRFYVDAYAGYGFPFLGGVQLKGSHEPDFDSHVCTMGEGIRVGVNIAYRFNKYLALEIGGMYVAYLNTNSVATMNIPIFDYDTVDYLWEIRIQSKEIARYRDYREVESRMGQFGVQLVASLGFSRWDPYVKAGLGFVCGTLKAKQGYSVSIPETPGEYSREEVYHRVYGLGKASYFRPGFIGAVGVNCHLTPTISLFAEWQFSVYGSYDISWGHDILQSEAGDTEIPASFGLRTDRMVDKDNVAFSSHGLNLGIKFKF